LFFDKAAKQRLKRYFGHTSGLRSIERWLNVYAVIGDNGRLVTVARRQRRFRRP
jgi:hypothetical protein